MNVLDANALNELNEAIRWLGLTDRNAELARDYFTAPADDDALLERSEPQTNFRGLPRENVIYAFNAFLRYDTRAKLQIAGRVLKFLWATGDTAVCSMVGKTYFGRIIDEDTVYFRAQVLGNVRTAVMEAAGLFESSHMSPGSLSWLCRMARQHPEDLAAAQKLCRGTESHASALLASLLLHFSPEMVDVPWQKHLLRRSILEAIPRILFGQPGRDIQMLVDYVSAGDLRAPVPVPPSIAYPAVDAASAQRATWMERTLRRTFGITALLMSGQDETSRCLLRMILMLHPSQVFYDASQYLPADAFEQVLPILREDTPGGGISLALFFAHTGIAQSDNKAVFMKHCRRDLELALQEADPDRYLSLLEAGLEPLTMQDVRVKLANGFSEGFRGDERGTVYKFITQANDLSDASARLEPIQPRQGHIRNGCMRLLARYIREEGLDDFAVRCTALAGLLWTEPGFNTLCWLPGGETDTGLMKQIIQKLCDGGLPVGDVLQICGRVYDSTYWDELRAAVRQAALSIAERGTVADFAGVLKNGSIFLRSIALDCLDIRSSEAGAKEAILDAAADSSKFIREQVAKILPRHPEWSGDYIMLLSAKKT